MESEIVETGGNTLDGGFNLSELRRAIGEAERHSASGGDGMC